MSTSNQAVKEELARLFAAIPLLNALKPEGKKEIGLALLRHCQSDAHVRLVVQTFLETVQEWRNPIAELVRIAKATRTMERAPEGCEDCRTVDPETGGPAWLDFVEVFDGDTYLRTDRCHCARGDWFRARKGGAA
jgi:hypothetical protein